MPTYSYTIVRFEDLRGVDECGHALRTIEDQHRAFVNGMREDLDMCRTRSRLDALRVMADTHDALVREQTGCRFNTQRELRFEFKNAEYIVGLVEAEAMRGTRMLVRKLVENKWHDHAKSMDPRQYEVHRFYKTAYVSSPDELAARLEDGWEIC